MTIVSIAAVQASFELLEDGLGRLEHFSILPVTILHDFAQWNGECTHHRL